MTVHHTLATSVEDTYRLWPGPARAGTPVYFQLNADNFWSTLQWPIAEYLRGVALDSQTDLVSAQILRSLDVSGLAGAEILVGYGAAPDEMLATGRYRTIFTVPSQ